MFPKARSTNLTRLDAPVLVASSGSFSVPENAITMLAYIVGGGGAGGLSLGNIGGTCDAPGGGCGGGALIQVDLLKWKWEASLTSENESLFVGITVGAGAAANTRTNAGGTNGATGGSTTLTLTGGLSVSVVGGNGGNASSGAGGVCGTLATANRINTTYGALSSAATYLRPLVPQPATWFSSTFSGEILPAGGATVSTVGSEVGNSGSSVSGIMLPWWMRRVGLTLGAGGSGAAIISSGKAAGGGGGGFSGTGGNGAVLNAAGTVTAGSGTGYGSGGGGACGITASTVTSGAGAPGCAVIVFEVEV